MKRSRLGLGNMVFHNLKEDRILEWFPTSRPRSTLIPQVEQILQFLFFFKKSLYYVVATLRTNPEHSFCLLFSPYFCLGS